MRSLFNEVQQWVEDILLAKSGIRTAVGPFTAPGAAGVTAASQTNLDMRYSHTVTAAALGYVAPRAGSIVGLSAALSAAANSDTIAVSVTKNGTEVALTATFAAGGDTEAQATADQDTLTFVAGDVIGVSYTSGALLANTPALVASVELES